ncbi:MAG: hypothetical protein IT306_14665 [Chloroflexi bacterium]|nr:hypothetical protein [Chloroflexota bacterium]
MVKSTTLESFQASEIEPIREPSPLAALAERMVRERSGPDPEPQEIAQQLAALDVLGEVDAHMALGEIKGRVREAAEAAGIMASYDLISAEAERIWTHYGDTRRASEATYSVGPDGLVDGYQQIERPAEAPAKLKAVEMPEMPLKPLTVPTDSVFGDEADFEISGALANRARVLISRHPEHLDHLRRLSVTYLWKRQGGKSKGRATFGKCSKPSGLLKHFSEAHFVVWLAADHCRAAGYGDREIEALLFHEMLHTAVSEVDENTGRGGGPALVPHDLEVFRAEVEVYGLWAPELQEVAPAFRQASLFATEEIAVEQELDREEAAQAGYIENPDTGAGVLIHDDGTPMTADEIAEMERRELVDDDYDHDDEDGQFTDDVIDIDGEAAG